MILRQALHAIVFDKHLGLAWRGKRDPAHARASGRKKGKCFRLDEIVALQLLAERVHVKRSSYLSYELNLVLADGERVNLVDHAKNKVLQGEAATLGRFLDVPVLAGPP